MGGIGCGFCVIGGGESRAAFTNSADMLSTSTRSLGLIPCCVRQAFKTLCQSPGAIEVLCNDEGCSVTEAWISALQTCSVQGRVGKVASSYNCENNGKVNVPQAFELQVSHPTGEEPTMRSSAHSI